MRTPHLSLILGPLLTLAGCGGLADVPMDEDEAALSTDCGTTRAVTCHDSPNNCSYPAKRCDPVPRALERASRTAEFALDGQPGHVIEDSLGNPLGSVAADVTSVHLNWGQRRTLHGASKVLAWAVRTDAGTVTGWINESALRHDISWMPSAEARNPGGAYAAWHVVDSDDTPYRDAGGSSLKVVESCEAGMNATDYLARNGRINLIYNLPGYDNPKLGSGTIDVYPIAARPVFQRADSQSSLGRPLFDCSSGRPVRSGKTLRFLYGHIQGVADRHGWIAQPNVAPGA
ncbi:MAG: hypothetical protein JWN44_4076 [Myxococcales bacterium]|nr:hypothetical protein [Myxococcales bacterium]